MLICKLTLICKVFICIIAIDNCHCERSEAISRLDCHVAFAPRNDNFLASIDKEEEEEVKYPQMAEIWRDDLIGAYFCKKNIDSAKYYNGAIVFDIASDIKFTQKLIENLQNECGEVFSGECDPDCEVARLKAKLKEISQ